MKRFELYVDNDDRLILSEFKNLDSEYESKIFKGKETYEMIRHLASSKLIDFSEIRKTNLILEYKNYIININDYKDVLRKKGTGILLKNIKDFEEKTIIETHGNKKVKRKNKYVGKKVVATSLVVLMLYAVGTNLIKKDESIFASMSNNPYSTEITLEKEQFMSPNKNLEKFEDDVLSVTLEYEDWSNTRKANITKSNYSSMISKYAKMYGIDPNLAIAIATQESDAGIHKTTMDPGGATGLMQIQNEVWVGNDVSAYNFDTKKIETLKVTKDNIKDVEYNIKIGCMILQNSMEYMNYNILAGIQCYNMGCGNVNDILYAYSKYTGKSREEILNDVEDIGWMEFRKLINVGEQKYVEKVFSWMGEDITIKNVKRDGRLVSINVGNQVENKKVY